jgi:hypothetical protein
VSSKAGQASSPYISGALSANHSEPERGSGREGQWTTAPSHALQAGCCQHLHGGAIPRSRGAADPCSTFNSVQHAAGAWQMGAVQARGHDGQSYCSCMPRSSALQREAGAVGFPIAWHGADVRSDENAKTMSL